MVGERQGSPGFARTLEDLWVWQQARQMVADVYRDFGQGTSAERDYAYRRQLQSAAVSVMNNIAEGFERKSSVEFHRFLDIAKGSCGEVRSMYYIAEDLSYITPKLAAERRKRCLRVSSGIAGLMQTLSGQSRKSNSQRVTRRKPDDS
jgi:four helix bundle protein